MNKYLARILVPWYQRLPEETPLDIPPSSIETLLEAEEVLKDLATKERDELDDLYEWAETWKDRYFRVFPTLQSAYDFEKTLVGAEMKISETVRLACHLGVPDILPKDLTGKLKQLREMLNSMPEWMPLVRQFRYAGSRLLTLPLQKITLLRESSLPDRTYNFVITVDEASKDSCGRPCVFNPGRKAVEDHAWIGELEKLVAFTRNFAEMIDLKPA